MRHIRRVTKPTPARGTLGDCINSCLCDQLFSDYKCCQPSQMIDFKFAGVCCDWRAKLGCQ